MSLQKHWVNFRLNALGAVLLSVMLVGCDEGVAQNAVPQAPAVSAADVVVKSISQWDSFNGRIEAVESVQLRPRVSGYIDKVNYTDGQEVKKGEVLFTIDDRTYRAALEQAQATLARAKTQASLAQSEASRTDKLINTNLVSREEWEQRRSAAAQAQADIRAAQAAVDAAQLNLDFTKVTAPIDGRASRALITSGNLVTAGDSASVLTTLVSQKTVYVYFDVDESTYLHYQNLARSGFGCGDVFNADVVAVVEACCLHGMELLSVVVALTAVCACRYGSHPWVCHGVGRGPNDMVWTGCELSCRHSHR